MTRQMLGAERDRIVKLILQIGDNFETQSSVNGTMKYPGSPFWIDSVACEPLPCVAPEHSQVIPE
jgi:hypothetical protein